MPESRGAEVQWGTHSPGALLRGREIGIRKNGYFTGNNRQTANKSKDLGHECILS